jgi:hypothetical protein
MLDPRIISFDADHNDNRGDGAALEAISRKDNMVVGDLPSLTDE